jgi:hypothetical protein
MDVNSGRLAEKMIKMLWSLEMKLTYKTTGLALIITAR